MCQKKIIRRAKRKITKKQKHIEQTLKKLNYKIQLYNEIVERKRKDFTEEI